MHKQAIFIMGPTAVGKTALAMQLSLHLPVDLISVDSAMVYRGMNIGTGKPTALELTQFPHQLIDMCDPKEAYSVAQFCKDATFAMQQSWSQQRIPLLVGGTMLYFKALQFGLSELPSANSELRSALEQEANNIGWSVMHSKLASIDPEAALRLNPNDSQRIMRALEINILTGQTLQTNYATQSKINLQYNLHSFAIMPEDRNALHTKIASRFDQMLTDGLLDEVKRLYTRGDLSAELPAMRAVGYRQLWAYLDQKIDYNTMRDSAIAATRQLAKRQYTWLRSWPSIENKLTYLTIDTGLDTIIKTMLHSLND